MGDERDDERVLKIIRYACQAGALRMVARQEPDAARGLNRCADFHSQRVETLAGLICEDARLAGPASART